jgi:N-acetylglucosaminylphosphatidylinositol deacetylase
MMNDSNDDTICLLVVAHPDDESMFFLPALRSLLTPCCSNNNNKNSILNSNVRVLCLSNGDYRSISDGPIRTLEMHDACSIIGIKSQYVTVVDDVRLRDGPNEVWNSNVICEIILDYICNNLLPPSFDAVDDNDDGASSSDDQTNKLSWKYVHTNNLKQQQHSSDDSSSRLGTTLRPNINIITFDQWGISKHPNHMDVYRGIYYLLHEKCCIKRHDDNSIRTTLQFALHNDDNKVMNDDSSNTAKLDITVYTLQTISNPIYKYFLWIFLDIFPFLTVWFIQTLMYLIYFLLGGLLLSSGSNKENKGSSRIQSFSRVTQSTNASNNDVIDGITLHCRLMDPILVWNAMTAHYSQFVWYRRLSVLFSRYTYINDLHQLTIVAAVVVAAEAHGKDDETDDDNDNEIAGSTSTSKMSILSPIQINALRTAVLPSTLHHRPWKRIYSLARDGDSFVTFRRRMEEWHGGGGSSSSTSTNSCGHQGRHISNQSSTLLVVKTANGEIIGGYADIPIIPWSSTASNSTAKSCLFKLNIVTKITATTTATSPEVTVDVYGKQHQSCMLSTKRIIFDSTRHIVAFGGSDSAKPSSSDDDGFGLCLTDSFVRGTTSKCAAYQMNAPLIGDPGGIFDVLDVEVWGFVFGEI